MAVPNGPHPCMNEDPPPQFRVPNGKLVYFPNRNDRYAYLYKIEDHPLVCRDQMGPGRTFLFIADTSVEARREQKMFEDSIEVPRGRDQEMEMLGLLEMQEGDIFLGRNLHGPRDDKGNHIPENDVPLVWCGNAYDCLSEEGIQDLLQAQDLALGDRDSRTPDCAAKDKDGEWQGGVLYERQDVTGVKGARCYPAGPTHQRARNMTSPTASGKVPDGGLTPKLEERKLILKAAARAGVASMNKYAPQKFRKALADHAELTNMPRIGCLTNVYYPAAQFNFAPAVAGDDCKEKGLDCMKFFGGAHRDMDDDGGGLTSMVANSDIPDGYEHGRFHILHLGVWVKLTPLKIVTFPGLYKHGGTPPLSPAGESPVSWAYRFMSVLYPPQSMLSGAGKQVIGLAALPNKNLFPLAPEMTSIASQSPGYRGVTNEANWANDGEILMDRDALFQFYTRSLLQVNAYLLRQLPLQMQACLAPNIFLSSLSYIDSSGTRQAGQPWDTAPTGLDSFYWSQDEANQDGGSLPEDIAMGAASREAGLDNWMKHVSEMCALIPSQINFDKELARLAGKPKRKTSQNSKGRPLSHDSIDPSDAQRAKRFRSNNGGLTTYLVAGSSTLQTQINKLQLAAWTPLLQPPDASMSSAQKISASQTSLSQGPHPSRAIAQNAVAARAGPNRPTRRATVTSASTSSRQLSTSKTRFSKRRPRSDANTRSEEADEDALAPLPVGIKQKKRDFIGVVLVRNIHAETYADFSIEDNHESLYSSEKSDDPDYLPPRSISPACENDAEAIDWPENSRDEAYRPSQSTASAPSLIGDFPPIGGSTGTGVPDNAANRHNSDSAFDPEGTAQNANNNEFQANVDDIPMLDDHDLSNDVSERVPGCNIPLERNIRRHAVGDISVATAATAAKGTVKASPLEEFMSSLQISDIISAINEITAGIAVQQEIQVKGNLEAAISLDRLSGELLSSNDSSTPMVMRVSQIWNSIARLEQHIAIAGADRRMARSTTILSFMSAYIWLERLVDNAESMPTSESAESSWILSLMKHFERIHSQRAPAGTTVFIEPSSFIPESIGATTFQYKVPGFRLEQNKPLNRKATIEAAQFWLGFPKEAMGYNRFKILQVVQRNIPSWSIFTLDSIWGLYQNPIRTLVAASHRRQCGSKQMSTILAALEARIKAHPFSEPSSSEMGHLLHLESLLLLFEGSNFGQRRPRRLTTITLPNLSDSNSIAPAPNPNQSLSLLPQLGRDRFTLYLKNLMPLVRDGPAAFENSGNSTLKKVACDPDYYMPFRDIAPTRAFVIANLCSDHARLQTADGFGSLLIHRCFFYGSEFGSTHQGFFTDDTLGAVQNDISDSDFQSYYIRNSIYGSASKHRKPAHIPKLWQARHSWPTWLSKQPYPTFSEVMDFLLAKKRFYGVGNLMALLIAGDLAVAGVVQMPTPQGLGRIIFTNNLGALRGLKKLGLIGSSPSEEQAVGAFVSLHNHLEEILSLQELEAMRYNILMLEHGLCKYTRLDKPRA